jgi:hypothetical protein
MGKVFFNAWSMDVKIEGENVTRNLDLTTHNHGSVPGDTPVWPYFDEAGLNDPDHPCADEIGREQQACHEYTPHGKKNPCTKAILGRSGKPSREMASGEAEAMADRAACDDCLSARRCALQPYDSPKSHCCDQQTGHHLIEASALHETGRGGPGCTAVKGVENYSEAMAPCVCAEGTTQNTGTHGLMHTFQSAAASKCREGTIALSDGSSMTAKKTTYGTAKKKAIEAFHKTFPESDCDDKCLAAQMDAYHKQCGIDDRTPIKAVETGQTDLTAAEKAVADRSALVQASRATGALS